jgi:hypothetical protein
MEHKADHPHPSGAKVKNVEDIPASPNMSACTAFDELSTEITLSLP